MNKKGMGLVTTFIVLVALLVGVAVTSQVNFDLDGFKDALTWRTIEIGPIEAAPDLGNALNSFVNGIGETTFHVAKWIAEWSSQHPEVPFKLLIYLLILSILAPLIVAFIKIIVILFVLIQEYFQSKKERKRIKALRGEEYKEKKILWIALAIIAILAILFLGVIL